jgi:tetratricopeptide (TPR) repeat protein
MKSPMGSFELEAHRANKLCFWITIAGILPSVWLGMLVFKSSGLPIPSSIFFAGLVEYTFIFVAYMVTRRGHRVWQASKYLVSASGASIAWACFVGVTPGVREWVGLFVAFGVGLAINALFCKIGYKISPALRVDDQIHHLTVWSGGKDLSKVQKQVNDLLLKKLPAVPNKYKKLLAEAEGLISSGKKTNAKKATRIFTKCITELEAKSKLSVEDRKCLGQAYLGLGKALEKLGQVDKAVDSYIKARSYGVWEKELDFAIAYNFASRSSDTPEAIQAYLSYLEKRRGDALDSEKKTIIAVLESICSLGKEELTELTVSLSKKLSFKAIGIEIADATPVSIKKRLGSAKELCQKIIRADPAMDWAHFYLGLGYFIENEMNQALAEFKEAKSLKLEHYLLTHYLGLCNAFLGNYSEALLFFETATTEHSQFADSQFHVGRLLLLSVPAGKHIFANVPLQVEEAKQLRTAMLCMQKAADVSPDRADYLFYISLAHYRRSEYSEAERHLLKAIALEPQWKEFYYLLALMRRELKAYKGAIESLQQAIELGASYQPAYSLMGQICFEEKDWPGAESNCRQAIQIDPSDELACAVLGQALFYLNRFEEATSQLYKVSYPDLNVLYCLGRSLMKISKFRDAIPVLEKLTETSYVNNALYLLGCAYANLGNLSRDNDLLDKAILWFNKAVEATGPSAEIHLQRANVYLCSGQTSQAYTDLQHSLALKPRDADVAYASGIYYRAIGDNEKAMAEFARAISINRNFGLCYFAQGLLKEEAGDLSTAAKLYSVALEQGISGEAQLRLGVVYSKLGDNEKAIAALTQARLLGIEGDELCYFLGWSYAMVSSYGLAIDEWQKLLPGHRDDNELARDNVILHYFHGHQQFGEGDYKGSIESWETCLNLYSQPRSDLSLQKCLAEASFRQGASYLLNGKVDDYHKALPLMQKAVEIDAQSTVYQYYLALADLVSGNAMTATERLEKLLSSDPTNWRYLYHLALALVQREEHDKAIPLLRRIITDHSGQANHLGASLLLADCYRVAGEWELAAQTVKSSLEMKG